MNATPDPKIWTYLLDISSLSIPINGGLMISPLMGLTLQEIHTRPLLDSKTEMKLVLIVSLFRWIILHQL